MPTEEIFTSPMRGKCEGRLVSTKPLSYQGQLINDFYIDFKDGKAVAWDAKEGKEVLEKIITSDEGAAMLGELALVPNNSPISSPACFSTTHAV
jgi:aminopeptidase